MPEMKMKYVAYYDSTFTSRDNSNETLKEKAEKYATAYGYDFVEILSPDEIRNEINLKPEGKFLSEKYPIRTRVHFYVCILICMFILMRLKYLLQLNDCYILQQF